MKNQILKPFEYNEQIFKNTAKQQSVFDDDFTFTYENDEYGNILNNVDKMKEGKWYRISDKQKIETFKELMRAGFLPDITFSEDFTKIKRQNTEFLLKINK
ncbi:MAG: hypothetical protein L3J56_06705 [Bacteroidales bacterium]|nr:hypothetical protein [Bacteroidales bacterium]